VGKVAGIAENEIWPGVIKCGPPNERFFAATESRFRGFFGGLILGLAEFGRQGFQGQLRNSGFGALCVCYWNGSVGEVVNRGKELKQKGSGRENTFVVRARPEQKAN